MVAQSLKNRRAVDHVKRKKIEWNTSSTHNPLGALLDFGDQVIKYFFTKEGAAYIEYEDI